MNRSFLPRLIRDAEAPVLFESFFVAAVASFLGIRAFLSATGYPRIGANGLHIAHMLWGGLLLLLAVLLLLAFLDRSVSHGAAVVAGLGFGTFIDEIGKFVTADNDYFYRPAIALIYGVFVVAFLVARVFVGQRRLTPDEALANSLDRMSGAPASGLEPNDRAAIRVLLDLADPADARTAAARAYLAAIPAVDEHDTILETVGGRLARTYQRVMALPAATAVLAWAVVAYAVVALVGVGLIALASGIRPGTRRHRGRDRGAGRLDDRRGGADRARDRVPARRPARRRSAGSSAGYSCGSSSRRCSCSTARSSAGSSAWSPTSWPTGASGTRSGGSVPRRGRLRGSPAPELGGGPSALEDR